MTTNKSEIQTAVKEHLSNRLRAQNLKGKARLKEEAAFIAGACAALHAVFGRREIDGLCASGVGHLHNDWKEYPG